MVEAGIVGGIENELRQVTPLLWCSLSHLSKEELQGMTRLSLRAPTLVAVVSALRVCAGSNTVHLVSAKNPFGFLVGKHAGLWWKAMIYADSHLWAGLETPPLHICPTPPHSFVPRKQNQTGTSHTGFTGLTCQSLLASTAFRLGLGLALGLAFPLHLGLRLSLRLRLKIGLG